MLILRTSKSKTACFQDHIRTPLVVSCPMVPDLAPDSTVPGRYGAHKFGGTAGYCRPASAPRVLPLSSRTASRLSYCSTARTCWGPSASSTGIHWYAWALAGAGPERSAQGGTVGATWRPPSAEVPMAAWAACTSSLPMARVCVRRVGGMHLEQRHSHAGPQPWLAGRGR